jgi:hypothetical protein
MRALFWMSVGRLFVRERPQVHPAPTWRGRLLRLCGLALLAALLWGAYQAPRSDRLRIHTVAVRGTDELSAAEVRRESGLVGASFWQVRAEDVEARLERLPWIARATVDAGFSDTASVTIQERTPALVLRNKAGAYLVDGEGVVLEAVEDAPRLPTMEQADRRRWKPGDTLDDEILTYALSLYAELPADVRPSIRNLTYEEGIGYRLISSEGWTAVLGDAGQTGAKVAVLRRVLSRRDVRLVDVSAPATPYYRRAGN